MLSSSTKSHLTKIGLAVSLSIAAWKFFYIPMSASAQGAMLEAEAAQAQVAEFKERLSVLPAGIDPGRVAVAVENAASEMTVTLTGTPDAEAAYAALEAAAAASRLNIESIDPWTPGSRSRSPKDAQNLGLETHGFAISMHGTFSAILGFIDWLQDHHPMLEIDGFQITPDGFDPKNPLLARIQLRFLSFGLEDQP